jgi:hypothetical protein
MRVRGIETEIVISEGSKLTLLIHYGDKTIQFCLNDIYDSDELPTSS